MAWYNSRDWGWLHIDRKARWLLWNANGFDRAKKKTGAHGRGMVHIVRKSSWLRGNGRRRGGVGMRSVASMVNFHEEGRRHRSSTVIEIVVAWRNSREWGWIHVVREAGWLLWNATGFYRFKRNGAHGRGVAHIGRRPGWLRGDGLAKMPHRLIRRRRRLTVAEARVGGPLL